MNADQLLAGISDAPDTETVMRLCSEFAALRPPLVTRKKLIEVGLPLVEINAACQREKSIRHGHQSTLHLWWGRVPSAAARAVLFSQMVDDPSSCPDEFPTAAEQEAERKRLHELIVDLVQWEATTDAELFARCNAEIQRSWQRACADNDPLQSVMGLFE